MKVNRAAVGIIHLGAGAAGGLSVGAALAFVGSLMPFDVRAAAATLLALVGMMVALMSLMGHQVTVLSRNRETPKEWVKEGPIRWALRNGISLGVGFRSRIGFWLWYVVPAGALIMGDLAAGAVVYGSYGFARGLMAGVLAAATVRGKLTDFDPLLVGGKRVAVRATSALLLILATSVLLWAGF